MTWLKLSDDFTDRTEALSDAAFRLHTEGLNLAIKREQGPYLPASKLQRWTNVRSSIADAAEELVRLGFWEPEDGGFVIREHMEHQPEPEVLAARRKNAAQRQRRKRLKDAGISEEDPLSRRDSPSDYPREDMRYPGRGGTGRVGTGRASAQLEGHVPGKGVSAIAAPKAGEISAIAEFRPPKAADR